MSIYGSNGAPRVIDRGIVDKSFRVRPLAALMIPQHLPVWYTFAEKGRVGRNYLDLDNVDFNSLYGAATLDVNSPYYTHTTPFIAGCIAEANSAMIHRLVPTDAKDVSNLVMFLDVLETDVPVYEKYSDGAVVYDELTDEPVQAEDSNGDPLTVKGYKVMWVTDSFENEIGEYSPNQQSQRPGIQTDGANQSIQYPIFEFAARDVGAFGNKLAISLSAQTRRDDSFPDYMLDDGNMYPYYFEMSVLKDARTGKTDSVLNSFGSPGVWFVGKKGGLNPVTQAPQDLKVSVEPTYIDVPAAIASGLGHVVTYDDNLLELSKKFYDAEVLADDDHRDANIVDGEENYYAMNIVSFVNSNKSPYRAIQVLDEAGSTRLTRSTRNFMGSGSDGTMNNEVFEALVAADVAEYSNTLHVYMNLVTNPESIIYDTGFGLDTKKALCNLIARRKDTLVCLSTFVAGKNLSVEEQFSLGVSLKSFVELYPESAFFGTSTVRAIIISGSGTIINSDYRDRVPMSYEILRKSAAYMGAANGRWVSGRLFDRAPNSIVDYLKDVDIDHVPVPSRVKFWSAGINFVLDYKIGTKWFPAVKSVYRDDTSVLTSYFTVMACCFLNKIQHQVWRKFSGVVSLQQDELVKAVNEEFNKEVNGRFDGLFRITPDAYISEEDDINGNSWTLPVKLEANNSKTVMTTQLEAYRFGDLDEI